MPIHSLVAILTREVGHTDLVFGMRSAFISIRLRTQDYKSLRSTICATLVNIQTDRQTHRQTVIWPAYINSSASENELVHIFITILALRESVVL